MVSDVRGGDEQSGRCAPDHDAFGSSVGSLAFVLAAYVAFGLMYAIEAKLDPLNETAEPWLWSLACFLLGLVLSGIGLAVTQPWRRDREQPRLDRRLGTVGFVLALAPWLWLAAGTLYAAFSDAGSAAKPSEPPDGRERTRQLRGDGQAGVQSHPAPAPAGAGRPAMRAQSQVWRGLEPTDLSYVAHVIPAPHG